MANKGKSMFGDEDFYSSLAAGVSDDESDADPRELARSLGGLDDMEDDILGSLTTKKKPAAAAKKPSLSQTMPAKSSLASGKGAAKPAASKPKFDINDIMGDDGGDNFDSFLSSRPKTTDDKKSSAMSDIFSESSKPKPRPATTEQPRSNKMDFGAFDEDDPLAGLDLSDEDTPKLTKKPPPSTKPPEAIIIPPERPAADIPDSGFNFESSTQVDAPVVQAAPEVTRPATRSGSRQQEESEAQLPIKLRTKGRGGSEEGSDWDQSSNDSMPAAKPEAKVVQKKPEPAKPAPKKKDAVTFSDDDDDLDLGIDDDPPAKAKPAALESKAGGGMMSSLFGKSDSVEKHLQRPGTGGSQKEFSYGSKPATPETSVRTEVSQKKISDEDDDIFGSYAPSAVSSRPGTGRSVRFEDEESGVRRRPATAEAPRSAAIDDDWLGLGGGPSTGSKSKRPLGLASTVDFSTSGAGLDDDWLDMASGNKDTNSRPKTAPIPVLDKKPPRTPDKKASTITSGSKIGGADDWLTALTAKVDDETDSVLKRKPISRQSSTEKPMSRQSSLDSTSGRRPAVTKQNSADDWLGLGDEQPISSPAQVTNGKATKPKPSPESPVAQSEDALDPEAADQPDQNLDQSLPFTKSALVRQPEIADDSNWLGLDSSPPTRDTDTEDWINAAKNRRVSQQKETSIFGEPTLPKTSGTFSMAKGSENNSRVLSPQSSKPTTPKQAVISSIFDDDNPVTSIEHQQPAVTKPTQPSVMSHQPPVMSQTPVTRAQHVFQPMFVQQIPPNTQPMIGSGALDMSTWNIEQDSMVQQHQAQIDQMQKQFNDMMDVRRQQQQAAIEQQRKLAEDAFKLQQQHLHAQMSGVNPSPVFPGGLSPTKQSEIQLNNVELEGKIRRLEHEKSHLESLVDSLKTRHKDEVGAIETSNKARILMVEESYQRREFRLREEIEQLTTENLSKIRYIEEEKSSLLSSQYRKLDELEQRKSHEIDGMRRQHRSEIERIKEDHQLAIDVLRKSKEQELESLLSTTSNPQSIQFLMEQMKQNAAGLASLQFNIGKTHNVTLDEREMGMNIRESQLKVLQECLTRQQDENDKERSRLQELMAKMEIQLREQERQLHQEKWTTSQEKSKLAALQTSVEQERSLLNEQLTRERSELSRAKDSFLAEQRQAMVQLADERRLLAEERSHVTVSQRMLTEKESEESLRQSQGSAKYEGMIKSMEDERESLVRRSKALAEEEKNMAADRARLEQEQEYVRKEQDRLNELAKKIQTEMQSIENFSKECVEKERGGREALLESKRVDSINNSRLEEITSRLEELKFAEKRAAEERLQLARERKQLESLKSMQLCAGCKQPITQNPYFSLSTPILRSRISPASVGVVAPQQLDLSDPNILQYKITADQDTDFLNEESAYLEALKYSPYHKKPVQ